MHRGSLSEEEEPRRIDLPPPTERKKRKGKGGTLQLSEATVSHGLCAAFGGISVLTRHKHWQKTTDRVKPIAEPLTQLLNTLPAEIVDRLEKHAMWLSLAYGAAVVMGPDVMVELEFRKLQKQARGNSGGFIPAGTAGAPSPAPPPAPPAAAAQVAGIAPEPDL